MLTLTKLFFTFCVGVTLCLAVGWQSALWTGGVYVFYGTWAGINTQMVARCPGGFYRSPQDVVQGTNERFSWECVGWYAAKVVVGGAGVACAQVTGQHLAGWVWPEGMDPAISGPEARSSSDIFQYRNSTSGFLQLKDDTLENLFTNRLIKRDDNDWSLVDFYYDTPFNVSNQTYHWAVGNITDNRGDTPVIFSFLHNNGSIVTTATYFEAVPSALLAWNNFVGMASESDNAIEKRADNTWISYYIWGYQAEDVCWLEVGFRVDDSSGDDWDEYNLGEGIGSYTSPNLLPEIDQKFCLAVGESSTRTSESVIVGEMYVNSYGGFDGDCWDG